MRLATAEAGEEGADPALVTANERGEGAGVSAGGLAREMKVFVPTQLTAPRLARYQIRPSKAAPTKSGKTAIEARLRMSSASPWISP